MTSSQIRAGRALVDMSQSRLAELAGVSLPTIKRMERLGPGRSAADNVEAVQRALEAAGVEFIAANGGGAGVRLKREVADG
ncbi:helix-turn-helix transcriptional regulator [Aurantimonas sp. C2-6-R+9]|uniref:helix-turn-helix transcriptional regulator n=1 Tax=unclassified Aurantimonas TaxID=2638230 RepID=UPI002E174A4F|nr:helix-turn-helix transcriptional regulator [Aurantimonas sp. C2-6-R+9]